jgi:hypothetical protein
MGSQFWELLQSLRWEHSSADVWHAKSDGRVPQALGYGFAAHSFPSPQSASVEQLAATQVPKVTVSFEEALTKDWQRQTAPSPQSLSSSHAS